MYNFKELKDNIAYLVQRQSDDDYKSNILGMLVNTSLLFLFNIYDYYIELQDIHNFTTVDATENYYMPSRFDKPLRIYDLTNDKKLKVITEEEYFDANIAAVADATKEKSPSFFRLYGVSGVKANISSSGTVIKALSSNSVDISTSAALKIVRIEGYIDSDFETLDYENLTLNGTTVITGTKTFYKITHSSKSADTTGYITLRNSSDTEVGILNPTDRVVLYKIAKLGKIPNQANSMRVLYKRRFFKMINDYDFPFTEDADGFLVYNAAALAFEQDKETIERAITMKNRALEELKIFLQNKQGKLGPDYQHKIISAFAQAHRQ